VNLGQALSNRIFGAGLASLGLQGLGRAVQELAVQVRRDQRIPMPDGVHLAADLYLPSGRGLFPTILIRTPYGRGLRGGPLGLIYSFAARAFAEQGYNVVVQDVRGRFGSQGEFAPFVHEAGDGQATLSWIAGQDWFNGVLGMWGHSYSGYTQWAVASNAPLYLKAMVPGMTTSRPAAIAYPDGAFSLFALLSWALHLDQRSQGQAKRSPLLERFYRRFSERWIAPAFAHLPPWEEETTPTRPGALSLAYQESLARGAGEPSRPLSTAYPADHRRGVRRATAAVHLVTGWQDFLLRELLSDYAALRAVGQAPYLTIGPWAHLDSGLLGECLRQGLAWFDAHLRGDPRRLPPQAVKVYIQAADEWRSFDRWPPEGRKQRLYLHPENRLAPEALPVESPPQVFCCSPARWSALPAQAGPALRAALSRDGGQALAYVSDPLQADLDLIGQPVVTLAARSNRETSNFYACLLDVGPQGEAVPVCDGLGWLMGGAERQPYALRIELWPCAYRLRAGRRLGLYVSSGLRPRLARSVTSASAFQADGPPAEQAIFFSPQAASRLELPVATAGRGRAA
jgi:hypothetical protein